MVGACLDKERVAFGDRKRLSVDVERPAAPQDDVDLVVVVRLLAVGFRRDEHVHAELEPRRAVHDLVPAAGRCEPPPRLAHCERVRHASHPKDSARPGIAVPGMS